MKTAIFRENYFWFDVKKVIKFKKSSTEDHAVSDLSGLSDVMPVLRQILADCSGAMTNIGSTQSTPKKLFWSHREWRVRSAWCVQRRLLGGAGIESPAEWVELSNTKETGLPGEGE